VWENATANAPTPFKVQTFQTFMSLYWQCEHHELSFHSLTLRGDGIPEFAASNNAAPVIASPEKEKCYVNGRRFAP
jgi:hypothetical protein